MTHTDELFVLENDVKWRNGNIQIIVCEYVSVTIRQFL